MTLIISLLAKATVLLLVAGVASLALRRSSAAARHLVWTLALASLLVLPALPWLLPAIPPPAALVESTAAVFELDAAAGRAAGWQWRDGIAVAWLAGFLGLLARLAVGTAAVRRLARRAEPAGSEGTARVLIAQGAAVPMTWGWRRPVVLLPAGSREWSDDLRRSVLLHELAHVERGDWLTRMLAQAACALYWFHPLAWLALRELVKESERACDDAVLRGGARASDYASHLLAVAHLAPRGSGAAAAVASVAMIRPSQLEGRLIAILDAARSRRAVPARSIAMAALAAATLVLPLAAMRPAPQEVTAPRAIHKVNPRYTDAAKQAKIEGSVELSVEIDKEGKPGIVQVLKTLDPGLDESAIEAVRQWRWEPGKKDGEPVAVRAQVMIHFSLNPPPGAQKIRVYRVGGEAGDVVAPRLLSKVEPAYTPEAKDAGIQGEVELYVEVWPDGKARNVRVEKSLDAGLDQKAIEAVGQWRFDPGTKGGEPVPVAAQVKILFKLQ